MTEPDLDELLALALELARIAARIHREGRGGPLEVETKSTRTDLVSRVDAEAERAVVEALRTARPDDAILAEEHADIGGTSGVRWLVDPLDGTVNYVHGYPMYAASIGVEVDGELAAGAIVDTVRDVAYTARRGGGARGDGDPISPSEEMDLSRCLIATGFSYSAARRAEQAGVVAYLLPLVADVRRGGSAALDLAAVAAGNVDAFYEIGLNPWDLAAGEVIVAEAGGRVEELAVAGSDDPLALAAPAQLFDPMRGLLEEAGIRFAD